MAEAVPASPKAQVSRLEFKVRNLAGKRRALCAEVGEAFFRTRPEPPPGLDEDFRRARERADSLSALEAEDAVLEAQGGNVSRSARLARSLVQAKDKGETFARQAAVDLRLKKLARERNAVLALLGRGIVARRTAVTEERVRRMFPQVDALTGEIAAAEEETGALREASAAVDPRMRRRLARVAVGAILAFFALVWWLVLRGLWA